MRRFGFTLSELLIVIIIIGIVAGLALPRFVDVVERQRSSEGVSILTAVRGSQERWMLEHSTYTTDVADLDIEIDMPTGHFDQLELLADDCTTTKCNAATPLGCIRREGDYYWLTICSDGELVCDNGTTYSICEKMGYN